jgi:predicted ArsR family transcriptional regulator
MNRTEFLKTCACGLCGCAAIGLLAPGNLPATETPKPEDWRFQFIKQRYAKLLENLTKRVGDPALDEVLHQQGRYCASMYDLVQKHKGDIDGFIREFAQQTKQSVVYDREKGVITVVGPETNDCFCPLIDRNYTPKTACNCSLGWNQYVFETTLGKKVRVELQESVLRGAKRCAFTVHVSDVAA